MRVRGIRRSALTTVVVAVLSLIPSAPSLATADGSADDESWIDRIKEREIPTSDLSLAEPTQVIVTLDTKVPFETTLSGWSDVVSRRAEIAADQNTVARLLRSTGSEVTDRFTIIPAITVDVTPAGLDLLRSLPGVTGIHPNEPVPLALDTSVPLIGAPAVWSSGADGSGWHVAVLDTGVQADHPMFRDGDGNSRVTEEACYSTTRVADGAESLCPEGAAQATGPGTGADCSTVIEGCGHGTHVAGIAAGSDVAGGSNLNGVAPGANIIAINVFSKVTDADYCGSANPCVGSYPGDQLLALQRIQTLANTIDIASINMSLGGGYYNTQCDDDLLAGSIESLRAAGIATVVASGNSYFIDGVSSPACISAAISVGSTTVAGPSSQADQISWFSNVDEKLVDVYAPGSNITSSYPTDTTSSLNGTSMAAPHVAGAWALLRQRDPTASVTQIESTLRASGASVSTFEYGIWAGFSGRRIDVEAAEEVLASTFLDVSVSGRGTVTSDPAGIDCGVTCTIAIDASPATYTLTASPINGYTFNQWVGCDSVTGDECTVTVGSTTQVVAEFAESTPSNDSFGSPTTLGESGVLIQSTINATREDPDEPLPECFPYSDSFFSTVWFSWTAPNTDDYVFETTGSNFDPILAVYTGNSIDSLSPVGGACDYGTDDQLYSDAVVWFTAEAGTTYYVQVGGTVDYLYEVGDLVLTWGPFADLSVAVSGAGSVIDETLNVYCQPACSSSFNAGASSAVALTAYPDAGHYFNGWTDDCSEAGTTAECTVVMDTDRTVGAVFEAIAPNDDFSSRAAIGALPTQVSQVSTIATSVQNLEPSPSCGSTNSTIWYSLVTTEYSTVKFDLTGSDFDTMLAIWTGESLSSLTEVACNDNAGSSPQSSLTANLLTDTTYYIQIGSASGTSGTIDLSVERLPLATSSIDIELGGDGGGTVSTEDRSQLCATGTCTFTASFGSQINVFPEPDDGSFLLSWTGPCVGNGLSCSALVLGDQTVGAVFAAVPDPYDALSATVGESVVSQRSLVFGTCFEVIPSLPAGLSISSAGLVEGVAQSQTLAQSYTVASWSGDCSVISPNSLLHAISISVAAQSVPNDPVEDDTPSETPDEEEEAPAEAPLLEPAQVAQLPVASDAIGNPTVDSGSPMSLYYPPGTFSDSELVVFTVYSTPTVIGSGVSGFDGSLNAVVDLSSTVSAGEHNLVAFGTESNTALRTPITVVGNEVFVALPPRRILDTRSGIGGPVARVGELDGSGDALTLQVTGVGGVPSSDVSAVALNVTVVNGEANDFGGFVTVYPCGTRPDASNLNFVSGQTVPNSVIAPLSADGEVCLYVYGVADLLVDVSGYFVSGFEPMVPDRILDTRSGTRVGTLDGSGSARELQVTGSSVPSSATAVALNVTVVNGEANDFGGFVTVYPCGTRPDASNLNFVSGQTVPNSVIAPLSDDGSVCLYVYGSAHLLVDVSGYFTSGFTPQVPDRILDTRSSGPVGELNGSGDAYTLEVTGSTVPASATAVALNVTVVNGEANDFGGFVTVYPCGTRPDASNLNFVSGQTVPNSVIAPLSSSGTVCLYVYGQADLLVDVSGHL